MENFVVSARKYRPATFDTVVGQSHITTTLKNAIRTKHLAQAFLFCGPRGVGKTTCARILAKTINCENIREDGEACGTCTSCVSYQNNNSFNIHELDAASNNGVDHIRDLVEQVRIPPQYGHYKIYIIDEVHMLSTAAFNAFLKTLEEPPKYALFILATTEKHKILPTILSRCQIFDFNRIKISDITGQLQQVARQEGIECEEEGLRVIARKADGGMRDALSMFDMISTFSPDKKITYARVIANLHILDSDYYFKLTDHILEGNSSALLLVFDEILRQGFDGHHFILGFAEHFRNLILASDPNTHNLLESGEETKVQYQIQSGKISPGFVLNLLHMANQVDLQYKSSKNQRLLVELALLKMANLKAHLEFLELEKKKSQSNLSTVQNLKNPGPSLIVQEPVRLTKSQFRTAPSLQEISSGGMPKPEPAATSESRGDNQPAPTEIPKIPFRGDLLATVKQEYLNWFKSEKEGGVSAWNFSLEDYTEDGIIFLSFANDFAEEAFQKEKPIWKAFLAQRFDPVPEVETQISEKRPETLKPYTNSEKFDFLSRKHPKLQELRLKLGLEAS